ncbi:hypothetical protein EGH21_13000 [Halomicroarcula sp. F13]|uniref:Uncharacterized protein n=1 Tax=Haloarcula rubra TaxID=2487747 RepID=A0AAW4PTE3_9EURY|nr:hypothetical protein [Halomicroarcula rubra]MBX0323949.1 hypothetical protein [Halomicroarcula rubra]
MVVGRVCGVGSASVDDVGVERRHRIARDGDGQPTESVRFDDEYRRPSVRVLVRADGVCSART